MLFNINPNMSTKDVLNAWRRREIDPVPYDNNDREQYEEDRAFCEEQSHFAVGREDRVDIARMDDGETVASLYHGHVSSMKDVTGLEHIHELLLVDLKPGSSMEGQWAVWDAMLVDVDELLGA